MRSEKADQKVKKVCLIPPSPHAFRYGGEEFSLFFPLGRHCSGRLSPLNFLVLSSPNPFGLLLLRPPHRDLADIDGRFSSGIRCLGDIPNRETAGKPIQHGIPICRRGSSGPTTPSSRSLWGRVPARQESIGLLVPYQLILESGQFGSSLTYLPF